MNRRGGVLICGSYGHGNAGTRPFGRHRPRLRAGGRRCPWPSLPGPRRRRRKNTAFPPLQIQSLLRPPVSCAGKALSQRRRQPDPGRHQQPQPLVLLIHPGRGQGPGLPRQHVRLRIGPVRRPANRACEIRHRPRRDVITLRTDSWRNPRLGETRPAMLVTSDPALTWRAPR